MAQERSAAYGSNAANPGDTDGGLAGRRLAAPLVRYGVVCLETKLASVPCTPARRTLGLVALFPRIVRSVMRSMASSSARGRSFRGVSTGTDAVYLQRGRESNARQKSAAASKPQEFSHDNRSSHLVSTRAGGSFQRVVGDFAGEGLFFLCLIVVEVVRVVIHGILIPTEFLIINSFN